MQCILSWNSDSCLESDCPLFKYFTRMRGQITTVVDIFVFPSGSKHHDCLPK